MSNQEKMLKRCNEIHQNKYDYSKVKYINSNTKIEIICPEHGSFFQLMSAHKSGSGCPNCAKNLKYTKERVLEKMNSIHNKVEQIYAYDLTEYKNTNQKIKIKCLRDENHGFFEQTIVSHIFGMGCPHCAKNIKHTKEQVLEQFRKVHQNKYDYSKVKYVNSNTKIEIICPEHGSFFQQPKVHKRNSGCPKCSGNFKFSTEEIIEKFKQTHNNKYDYSKVLYNGDNQKVEIVCPEHGSFFPIPFNHKRGSGCPQCIHNSKEEFLINLFKEYNINYLYRDRNLIKPLEIDILVPDFNFGIEHNGIMWHSFGKNSWDALDNYKNIDKNKHLDKTLKVEEQDFQLFHIREDHLLCPIKKEIWKSVLLNKCGISHKIHARKLKVVNLENYKEFTKIFLKENHLQGNCVSSIKLGLQDPKTGIVYSIMTFGKSRFDKNIEYELLRFCNLKYHNVRGAASKLMSAFEKYYKPKSIVSYANRDWSKGNLYKAIGFTYIKSTNTNYYYFDNTKIPISRQQVQKHKLKAFLESRNQIFIENLSERDNMINNGYRIYYDAGNLVYHKKYSNIGI